MGQVSMTVRVDSNQKRLFDQLCSEFGMSANTAMNIFVNAVVRTRRIPFEISASQEEKPVDGLTAFYALRAEAQKNGVADMSLDDINEEIRLARAERDKREGRRR